MSQVTRRTLLRATLAAPFVYALPLIARAQTAAPRFEPQVGGWRTFEITTIVTVADVNGATQLWLPVPDLEIDYQRSLDNVWTGNAARAGLVSDPKKGVRMLHAEFPGETAPALTLTSRVQTRNRAVDWSRLAAADEDTAALKANLAPSELQPLDGIVRKTALDVAHGANSDVEKVRALYNWVVTNSYREPKVRGCGTGDIKTMLETGNLGGKCADLNALFVGLCRAVDVPARDVYVLKVMRQENPEWIKDVKNPLIAPVNKALFGSWEGNWVGWNTAHDLSLPGSGAKPTLPFLMYPQGQNDSGRFDELAPDSFRYPITARELTA
jgi:transglutaminase-like putative cysteine protease